MTPTEGLLQRVLEQVPIGYRTNPFEAWVAVFGIVSGVLYTAGVAQSTALSEALPGWASRVWGVLLLVSCVAILRGLHGMVDNAGVVSILGRAIAAYQLGLRLLIAVCAVYAPALMIYAGTRGLTAAMPYFGLGIAAALRLVVIRVSLAKTPGWRR